MSEPSLREKVAFLERPETYPDRPLVVDVKETHMSWVFLTERDVYKLKKPVRWEELDHSTLELRRRDCEAEVRLNRRLAPDVYRGTVPLTAEDDGLALGGGGRPVEWLVWMQRLPESFLLDAAIRDGNAERRRVLPAARLLADFYAKAEAVDLTSGEVRERLRDGVEADVEELARPRWGLDAARIRDVGERERRFLAERTSLLDRRVGEGRVVEGHGDLRPEHVCLEPEPAIIDCLEFSRDLRLLDPADELAFLHLECERLGAAEVGLWFLETYREATGDAPPTELLRFYRAYRALRRAKISIWHLRDDDVEEPGKWIRRAERYLALALADH